MGEEENEDEGVRCSILDSHVKSCRFQVCSARMTIDMTGAG